MVKIRLEECCEILDSKRVAITAKDRKSGRYPYYGANGIQDYVNDYIFDDELVLLAEDGGNFGSKVRPIAYRVSGKCWVNNHAHVLKAKEMIDIDYLCYSLMFYDVGGMVNGATRQKLTQSQMRQMLIPKRTHEEQKEIVKKLDSITRIKDKRREQLNLLDKLTKSRFVEMFGDAVNNDMKWKTVALNDLCNGIGDGLHGTPEYDINGAYPFINGNNLDDGKIVITATTKRVGQFEYDRLFINLSKNAILISINGTLGKIAFYNGEKVCLGKSACYCNLKDCIDKIFVYGVMTSDAFKLFLDKSSTKSTIKNVGLKAMREYHMIIPPVELQKKFEEFVQQVDKLKFGKVII